MVEADPTMYTERTERDVFELQQLPVTNKSQSLDAYDQIVVIGTQNKGTQDFHVYPLNKT